jgi:hypothetical protein
MSEKSFAVASISVAVVWGTFFYPPAPQHSAETVAPMTIEQPVERARAVRPAINGSALALSPAAMKISHDGAARPAIHTASLRNCPIGAVLTDCAPLHKLAGD